MYGDQAFARFLGMVPRGGAVLDIGGGGESGYVCKRLASRGVDYQLLDIGAGEDWETCSLVGHANRYDGVWMSHVLEHLLDTHSALRRLHVVLKDGGVLAVTVPPLKHNIVGGHVSLWNAGLVLYRLVMARFDCSQAAVKTYGYNCSVIVRRREIDSLPDLQRDAGDLDALARYFPVKISGDSFDGQIGEVNWNAG